MTINSLSNKWLESSGSAVGFLFKSSVSGKVFKVASKTPGGKFLCVLNGSSTESLLDGNVDRYVMYGGSNRITEINAKITELETQRDAIEAKIETLMTEVEDLENAV